MLLVYALVCLAIVALPAAMTAVNLRLYRPPPPDPAPDDDRPWLAVCIPARDEADNIEACARGVLEGDDERTRVYVYDDESTDATPEIIARLTAETDRVRLAPQVPLPEGCAGGCCSPTPMCVSAPIWPGARAPRRRSSGQTWSAPFPASSPGR